MNRITESPSKKEDTKSSQDDSTTSDNDHDEVLQRAITLKRKRAHNDTVIIGMEIDVSKNLNTNFPSKASCSHMTTIRKDSAIVNNPPDLLQTKGAVGDSPRNNQEIAVQVSSDEDLTSSDMKHPFPKRRKMSSDQSSLEDYRNRMTALGDVFEELHYPNENKNALRHAMNNLPTKSTMFYMPLDRDYSENDLFASGAGSFSGTDKECYKNISDSTDDSSWKKVIVQVKKSVFKSCDDDDDDDDTLSSNGDSSKELEIVGIYNENGGKFVCGEYTWLSADSFDRCITDDGLVLIDCPSDLQGMWGEGSTKTKNFQCQGSTLNLTTTSYIKTFLVVYTDCSVLFHMLKVNDDMLFRNDHIQALVSHAQQNPDQILPRLFHVLQEHSFDLNSSACHDLINLFMENSTRSKVPFLSVMKEILIHRNVSYDKFPTNSLTDLLIVIIDHHGGWNNPFTLWIQHVLKNEVTSNEAESACELLQKVDLLLRMRHIRGCKLHQQIDSIIATFEEETQLMPEFTSCPDEVHTEILRIEQYHCWSDIKQAVNACFQRLEIESNYFALLYQRAVALHAISFNVLDFDDYQLCDKVVEEITKKIEEIPTKRDLKLNKICGSNWIEQRRMILKSSFLLEFFSTFGKSKHFKRIQRWSGKATLVDLNILTNTFNEVAPDCTCTMWLNRHLRRTNRCHGLEPLNKYQSARKHLRRNVKNSQPKTL